MMSLHKLQTKELRKNLRANVTSQSSLLGRLRSGVVKITHNFM